MNPASSPLTDKSDLAFLDNIDELNTAWPDYQVSTSCIDGMNTESFVPHAAACMHRTFKTLQRMYLAASCSLGGAPVSQQRCKHVQSTEGPLGGEYMLHPV